MILIFVSINQTNYSLNLKKYILRSENNSHTNKKLINFNIISPNINSRPSSRYYYCSIHLVCFMTQPIYP